MQTWEHTQESWDTLQQDDWTEQERKVRKKETEGWQLVSAMVYPATSLRAYRRTVLWFKRPRFATTKD